MQAGEIYLARFPFGDVPGMKLRPVLLLTGTIGSVPEVLVAYISSVLPAQPLTNFSLFNTCGAARLPIALRVLRRCAGFCTGRVRGEHANRPRHRRAARMRVAFEHPQRRPTADVLNHSQ